MEQQAPSSTLLELPPELRNSIYHLVFSEDIPIGPIELKSATPPRKALALVNRQLYKEYHLLCRDAYRDYWATNDFKITKSSTNLSPEFWKYLPIIERRTMGRFKSLTILFDLWFANKRYALSTKARLVDPRGVWSVEHRNVKGMVIVVEYYVLKSAKGVLEGEWAVSATIEGARAECEAIKKTLGLARQVKSMVKIFESWERFHA